VDVAHEFRTVAVREIDAAYASCEKRVTNDRDSKCVAVESSSAGRVACGVENFPGCTVKFDGFAVGKVARVGDAGGDASTHQCGEVRVGVGEHVPLFSCEINGHFSERFTDFVNAGDVVRVRVGENDRFAGERFVADVLNDFLRLGGQAGVDDPARATFAKINRKSVLHIDAVVGDVYVKRCVAHFLFLEPLALCRFGHALTSCGDLTWFARESQHPTIGSPR
jgi:hypothetical protein